LILNIKLRLSNPLVAGSIPAGCATAKRYNLAKSRVPASLLQFRLSEGLRPIAEDYTRMRIQNGYTSSPSLNDRRESEPRRHSGVLPYVGKIGCNVTDVTAMPPINATVLHLRLWA